MGDKLLIIGAGGHGKVVADIAIKIGKWKTIEFLDDNPTSDICMGLRIRGKVSDALKYSDEADMFVAIGNNEIRGEIQKRLEDNGISIPVLIHPKAVIGSQVELGYGTVVMAGVVINNSTKIGKACIINTGSSIDHDNNIEDYVHISPGVNIAGNVNVGKSTWLGIGSTVINNINVCDKCVVGAGAVVVKDIKEYGTYIGVPARRV